jgi:ketosteroid isomerase-like protein
MTVDVQAQAKSWDSAFNAGDISKLASFYAAGASIVPAGGTPVAGPDAIGAFFADVQAKGLTRHEIGVSSVIDRGDTVIAIGTWKLTGKSDSGEVQSFGGNWVNVLARDGDGWKIQLHTWN